MSVSFGPTMIKLVLILSLLISIAYSATLNVHLDQPAHEISPHLFGIFIEEINHGLDGGMEKCIALKVIPNLFFLRSSC